MPSLSEDEGAAWPSNLLSILDSFTESVGKHPDALALVCTHQPPDLYQIGSSPLDKQQYKSNPYLRWTYKHLQTALKCLMQGLRTNGVRRGMPIFTFVTNSAEYVLALWASFHLGCIFVPINPRNLQNTEEVTHMIQTAWKICHAQPGIIIADNNNIARQITELKLENRYTLFVRTDSGMPHPDQTPFKNLMQPLEEPNTTPQSLTDRNHSTSTGVVLFTSGTTSFPKGCFVTLEMFKYIVALRQRSVKMQRGDVPCLSLPNNHGMNINFVITALCVGATVVYPGPTFNTDHMLETLLNENGTKTILVPTMVYAMAAEIDRYGGKIHSLKSCMISGAAVTPEVLATCQNVLGAKKVESSFGMTEGAYIFGGARDRTEFTRDHGVSVGKVNMGCRVKICPPGGQNPIPRGIPGELQYSSSSLVNGYIDQATSDFYEDDGGQTWFKTGDQAIMDDEGFIFIVGRYKENIIRGGENVAPAAIEAVLARAPSLATLNPQIVGVPDSIAGEVPVAVVSKSLNDQIVRELQETVLRKMGPQFVPDEVLSLDMLKLDDFPKTMSGKLQRTKLAQVVREYRQKRQSTLVNGDENDGELENSLKQIWKRAIGYDVDENASISDFADSITLMRVRDRISKETGKQISLTEMIQTQTVAGQLQLLREGKASQPQPSRTAIARRRQGPPTSEDILPFSGGSEHFETARAYISKSLEKFDLSWDDIDEVMPVYDFVQIFSQTGRFNSWTVHVAILPYKGSKPIRSAMEETLKNNPIMTAFMLWNQQSFGSDIALYVVPAMSQKVINACIVDGGKLQTEQELRQKCLDNQEPKTMFPGPMFHATVFEIEETGGSGIVWIGNHAVLDGSYGQLFYEDLDKALGGEELVRHTDYKIWSDSYFSLRTSFEAQQAVAWHVRRLQNIIDHRKGFFPSMRVNPAAILGPTTPKAKHGYSFPAPSVVTLRRQHRQLTVPVIIKTAYALIHVYKTGHTHALFSNLEAARTRFPFVPQALEQLGNGQSFEASDVGGATFQSVVNLIEIKPEETVLTLLNRMQQDQEYLTKYASAPLREIMSQLGDDNSQMMLEVFQRSVFNWVPGMGATGSNPYSKMEVVFGGARANDMGLLVSAGFGGKDSSTVFLRFKGYGLTVEELERLGKELEKVTLWLIDACNWERPVGLYKEALKQM